MNSKSVCIVGLGYVGLPLAATILSKTNFNIVGYDVSNPKIESLKSHDLPVSLNHLKDIFIKESSRVEFTSNLCESLYFDAIIICVPTPLRDDSTPNIDYVENVFSTISKLHLENSLVILESTVYPGCTEELGNRYLLGSGCHLCFSPEREDPGNQNFCVNTIPKVVSSSSAEGLEMVQSFYLNFIDHVVPVSSIVVAELTKLLENTQRAVNISLMNEIKMYTDLLNIDIFEVVKAASTKPFGFTPYYPGPGIGGHCIPIDPMYLSWASRKQGLFLDFIENSAKINIKITDWIANKVITHLSALHRSPSTFHCLFVGLSYKKNIDDHRTSPSKPLIDALSPYFCEYSVLDPFAFDSSYPMITSLDSLHTDMPIVSIIITDHDCIDFDKIENISDFVFDSRGRYSFSKKVVRI